MAHEEEHFGPHTLENGGQHPDGGHPASSKIVLLVSLKRTRFFYERAAKELFASGVEIVEISGLGEAACTAVELASTLEEKKTAVIVKIQTKSQSRPLANDRKFPQTGTEQQQPTDSNSDVRPIRDVEAIRTPGIRIVMKKHPDFKGSRITPAQVTWCPKPEDGAPVALFNKGGCFDVFAAIVSGDTTLGISESGPTKALARFLESEECGQQNIEAFAKNHRLALDTAWQALYQDQTTSQQGHPPVRLTEIKKGQLSSTDLKVIYCRPCLDLHGVSHQEASGPAPGAVFIDLFDDDKVPYGQSKNYGLIYVVSPTRTDYSTKAEYMSAVRKTAANLMSALCDYNGMVRRDEISTPGLRRLVAVRISLFHPGDSEAAEVTKLEIAEEMLCGLSAEFHYGASPRLNFAYDDDVFKTAWIMQTGMKSPHGSSGIEPHSLQG